MSYSFDAGADDLLRLWQDTTLPRRDPEQLARRIARMKVTRFDRAIARRNLHEYTGVVAVVLLCAWQVMAGGDRISAAMAIVGALFVGGFLWWKHRQIPPLDPSMDGREYRVALLHRVDHQIRLLKGVRYWYLLPLYLPTLRVTALTWARQPGAAVLFLVLVTIVFVLVGWLNERVAVAFLERERARVQSLYGEVES